MAEKRDIPSIGQIYQTFGGADLYPSVEEKAAMLLYLVVKNHGFNSAHAAHYHALFGEFIHRGIDVSAISDGHSISFAHHVALDESAMKLVIQG